MEDVVQEAFLKVYRNHERVREEQAVQYMMRAVSNTARDYNRRRQRRPGDELSAEIPIPPSQISACYARERRDLYEQKILPALGALPEAEREPVISILTGEPGVEAARRLGVAETTFYGRRKRGLEKLAQTAREWPAEGRARVIPSLRR